MKLVSTSPFDGFPVLGTVESSSFDDVQKAVATARDAQPYWADLPLHERNRLIQTFIEIARSRSEEIALLIARETGRPITGSRANVTAGLEYFEAYLAMAEKHLSPMTTFETADEVHRVFREPWGVVACICPWNFPFLNVAWQCGQALIAGNAIVYKNSEENPLFGRLVEDLVSTSQLPPDVFNVVHGNGEVGRWIIESNIDLISFTGSTATGRSIAIAAASKFVPYVAELGGSAPGVVFEDANVDSIVATIYRNRFKNAGQSCDALKRLVVHESLFDEVIEKLREVVEQATIGHPLDESVDIGPLVSQRQLELLEAQVKEAVERGARVVTGGERPEHLRDGNYYAPTILTDIHPDMRVWREEVFGPVLPVSPFATEQEAIDLANDTQYGLGAWVMTEDRSRFERVARALQTGMVSQNHVGYWSPQNPFGGYKMSGMGRTHGEFGFHEMTQVKLVSSSK